MKIQTLLTNRKLPFLLALGCAALTGCFSDSGNNGGNENHASLQGRLQGDVEADGSASASGWQGTVVTVHEVTASGALGATEDSAVAGDNGDFHIDTHLRGHHQLVLRGVKNGQVWMSRHESDLADDETENTRPLTLESTLETAVWLDLQGTEEGRSVSSSEVSLAIDAHVAASSRGEYRGADSTRAHVVAALSASIKAASRAREAYLEAADSVYAQSRAGIDSGRARAEAALTLSLYAANGNQAQKDQAEQAYVNAMLRAYLDADVRRTSYARSGEAAYEAMIQASARLSDSSRTAMARVYAEVFANASDTAMRDEFRRTGASQSRLQLVADAGAHFRSAVDTSRTRAGLDSAVARFRAETRAAFTGNGGSGAGSDTASFGLLANLLAQLTVTTRMDSLSLWLQAALLAQAASNGGAGGNGDAVGEAYADAQVGASAEFRDRMQGLGRTEDESRAAADLMAFLAVSARGR